ncbi:MAG: hypothetical protein AB7P49_16875 [Bdellovibrionales bacterium]
MQDFKQRAQVRLMNFITTDEYPTYESEILEAYGETVVPERTDRRCRPAGLKHATVHKIGEKGRVVKVEWRVIFGTVWAVVLEVVLALARSLVSKTINSALVERNNGTDSNRNAR